VAEPTWLEQRPQRQDSLADQLTDLHRVAARLGMYDAADWLWKAMQLRDDDPWDELCDCGDRACTGDHCVPPQRELMEDES